jgi:ribosomal protein L7/L12
VNIDDDILNLVATGDYLDAARRLQSRTGISLEEAAAEIERLRAGITPLYPAAAPAETDPITPAIAEAIRAGRKIEAIKLYRQAHGVGLKEAKDAVDAYETTGRGTARPPKNANPAKPGLLRRLLGG